MSALTPEDQRKRLIELVTGLQEQRFFGKVELDMQGGNILRVVKHESIKLEGATDGKHGCSETQTSDQQAQGAAAET